jgi:hypothetical protein
MRFPHDRSAKSHPQVSFIHRFHCRTYTKICDAIVAEIQCGQSNTAYHLVRLQLGQSIAVQSKALQFGQAA